jgi:putative heme-binding domain-containing protein
LQTLVSRSGFARKLLQAVTAGTIPREDVSAFQLRQLRSLGDVEIEQTVLMLWPELAAARVATAEKIAHYEMLLQEGPGGDALGGKELFGRACASCHILFGAGGKVGPDLTGGQRTNLRYLLENILDPSAQVAENFRLSVLVLADGRVVNGVIGEQTEQQLVVHTPTDRLLLPRDEIEEILPSNLSMMPEHLLDPFSPQEVRDLFAYLMSAQPPPEAGSD